MYSSFGKGQLRGRCVAWPEGPWLMPDGTLMLLKRCHAVVVVSATLTDLLRDHSGRASGERFHSADQGYATFEGGASMRGRAGRRPEMSTLADALARGDVG